MAPKQILSIVNFLHYLLVGIHTTASAVWLGSMCYSLFVFQPRMQKLMGDAEAFEEAARAVAFGMRYAMLLALGVVGLSGFALLLWPGGMYWWGAVGLKIALWLAAVGLFTYVTTKLWPVRIFSTPDELPAVQLYSTRMALIMLGIVGLAFGLGITAAHLF